MITKPLKVCVNDINNFLYMNQTNVYFENLYINNWFTDYKAVDDTWEGTSFAFYDSLNNLVGWFCLSILRPADVLNIDTLCIINRKFSVSIFRAIIKFIKFRFNNSRVPKLTFCTMEDSKASILWDRIIERYDGNLVGIKKNQWLDMNGNYRGQKMYEIHNPKFKGG